jgi:HlyD family secretion protein
LVREGQRVAEGQVLFRLDQTQAQANLELQQNQLDSLVAQETRLLAERDGLETIAWPEELLDRSGQPNVARAMADQTNQFLERRASLSGQVDVLKSRIEQLKTEIDGLKVERDSTTHQLGFIVEELKDLQQLLTDNLVQKSRFLALEREPP